MTDETIVKTVRTVITRILEDAAFVFTDELDPEAKPDPPAWNADGVSLAFSGEKTGSFRLWAGRELARTLTANILGCDDIEQLPDHKVLDAFKETANIIAGNSLTELFGDAAVFNLGLPEQADSTLLTADCTRPDGIWLKAEEGGLLCVVEIQNCETGATAP